MAGRCLMSYELNHLLFLFLMFFKKMSPSCAVVFTPPFLLHTSTCTFTPRAWSRTRQSHPKVVNPFILIAITYILRREATGEQSHFLFFVHCYHTTRCNGVCAISCCTAGCIMSIEMAAGCRVLSMVKTQSWLRPVRPTIDRGAMTY